MVSLPTSAASLSCCATPRTSVPASSLRSAYVYSQSFFRFRLVGSVAWTTLDSGRFSRGLAVSEWYCVDQSCRGRLIPISAWTIPHNYCSVYQRPRPMAKVKTISIRIRDRPVDPFELTLLLTSYPARYFRPRQGQG